MREKELRERATCGVCHNKIGQTGLPMFWTVTIERHAIDVDAVRKQQGLALMLGGNGLLAMHMGTDEEMTKSIMEPVTVTVCEDCCTKQVIVAELAEQAGS